MVRRSLAWVRREVLPSRVEVVVWVFVAVTIIVGWWVAASLGMASTAYRDAVIPVVVGVVIGLPIAMWVSQLGKTVEEARAKDTAHERRRVVFAVIRAELEGGLAELHSDRAQRPRQLIIPSLKTEAWQALAASGDLRSVDDPLLLARIARAYHRMATTTHLEQQWMSFLVHRGLAGPWPSPSPEAAIRETLEDQDGHTIAAIEQAIAGIDAAEPGLERLDVN